MQFIKLRLSGFKSFVEATEFAIEPGLTGIVGPNGCGKSNLVEAIRWVMGENRAKQMRGGEMDDVIFAGTVNRPARNVAEVGLVLDNAARKAPAAYNDLVEIEVARRIERSQGSSYRIAGREVRARDVQLLFADAATGAHSPALVSQGRVAAIIAAKPIERRQLLEEAAGITGLHSRRHEAELKLKAAEANLARLDDVIATLDVQFQGLKKQARQAARYRKMSDLIRRTEALLLNLRWKDACIERDAAAERLAAAERIVAEITGRAAVAATQLADAQAQLPDLRKAEAGEAAGLARLAIQRDQLEAEERRLSDALGEIAARLANLAADRVREESQAADARAALARLSAERAGLVAVERNAGDARRDLGLEVERERRQVEALDAEVARATEAIAAAEAERAALDREIGELVLRGQTLGARLVAIEEEKSARAAAAAERRASRQTAPKVATAEASLAKARTAAERAGAARRMAEEEEKGARERMRAADADFDRIEAEIDALGAVLDGAGGGEFTPVLDHMTVTRGFETALGAALGDDLAAPLDAGAPLHWRHRALNGPAPALPAGARPLAEFVKAPPALARRLSQIGVVDDDAAGARLAAALVQGQRLVSRAGALWRWDGFTIAAGTPTAAATRLAQRRRRDELQSLRARAAAEAEGARSRVANAEMAARKAVAEDQRTRQTVDAEMAALGAARDADGEQAQAIAADAARLGSLDDQIEQTRADLAQHESRLAATQARLGKMPDGSAAREKLAADRARLGVARARLVDLQTAHGRLTREAEARAARLSAIADDESAWSERMAGAKRQLDVLALRTSQAEAERERLAARPAEIAAERSALIERLEEAEARRRAAADRLAEAERAVAEADRRLKGIDAELMTVREERVRAEALLAQAEQRVDEIVVQIRERLDCAPEETLAVGGLEHEDELPMMAQISARLDRLIKERDTMGPVNLRAEQEAAELEQQITTLRTEKDDLTRAIARLRHGIASLNREGRERLLAAFAKVNKHFQDLFVRLYGGGRAHLALATPPPPPAPVVAAAAADGAAPAEPAASASAPDAESDPLEAGLEVMASPPGKKLQSLTLLSGGEQALTAIALLFAVFLTNPAPICVLDEVDAPLDDANVDRFCRLLDEIAQTTGTRFILVTHHRLTMARMHRLYGVTMAERGISQIVSVDLRGAARMRATA